MSEFRKGKTYEEIYSKEGFIKVKRRKQDNWLGERNPNFGKKPVTYISLDLEDIRTVILQCKNIMDLAARLNINHHTLRGKFKREYKIGFREIKRLLLKNE